MTARRGIRLKDASEGAVVAFSPPKLVSQFGPSTVKMILVEQIRADVSCQFRADGLDADYVVDLAQLYRDDRLMPPLAVFEIGDQFWLADGFHRYAALRDLGSDEVEARVYVGDRLSALRYALQANGAHGKRRTLADAAFAYRQAVAEALCDPVDVPAVAALLGISDRWARQITREARERLDAERDATIERLAAEGKTQREIAKQVGMTQRGVGKALENKRKSSESSQAGSENKRKPSESSQVPTIVLDPTPVGDDLSQQGLIARLLEDGQTPAEIAGRLGIPGAVVQRCIDAAAQVSEPVVHHDPRAVQAAIDLPRVLLGALQMFDAAPAAFQVVKAMGGTADRAAYARLVNALAEHLEYAREALKVAES